MHAESKSEIRLLEERVNTSDNLDSFACVDAR
jgi:hypothetical protein